MSRNRILITAVAAALLVVCGIGIFFASNRDHAAERADEWTMQGMTLAPDGSATPCTVRIAGTSRSYLLGGRVGAFETGTDGGIYVDGTRVCSGGAGDTFAGALLASLAQDWSLEKSVCYAQCASAICVTRTSGFDATEKEPIDALFKKTYPQYTL